MHNCKYYFSDKILFDFRIYFCFLTSFVMKQIDLKDFFIFIR